MYSDVRSHDTVAGVTSAWRPQNSSKKKCNSNRYLIVFVWKTFAEKKKKEIKKKLLKEEKESLPAYRGLIHHIGAEARYRYVGNHSECPSVKCRG